MQKKKHIPVIISLLVSLGIMACIALSAQNAPVSSIGNVTSYGNTATVPVTASSFSNIGSFSIKILYDQAFVHPTAVTINPVIGGNLSVNLNNPGVIFLSWFTYPGITLAGNPVILNIDFARMAFGTSALSWFDDGYSCAWYDGNSSALIDTPTATYYIAGSVSFNSPDAPHTILPSINACPGSSISIPVKVTGYNNIGKSFITLDYNNSSLVYQGFTNNSGFPGLAVDGTLPGKLIISGTIITGGPGFSLTDSSALVTLNFNYLGGAAALMWFDDGVSCQHFGSPPSFFILNDSPQNSYYLNGAVGQNPLPAASGAISGPPGGNVCAGQTGVSFSVSPIPNTDVYVWSLPPGAIVTSGAMTNTITVDLGNTPGNWDIAVNGNNACGNGAASPAFSLYVNAPPAIAAQPVSPGTVNAGEGSASFTVETSGSLLTYQWQELTTSWNNIVNDSIHSDVYSPSLTITHPPAYMDGYHYRCIINGYCLPQVISDGEAYLSVSNLTGIELKDPKDSGRSNNISLKIHPNPATTETTLTYVLPADGYVVMEIWNLYGKKVEAIYNGNQCSGTHILEFPVQIHTGVYTISLSLKTGHEQYKTAKKFIIKD